MIGLLDDALWVVCFEWCNFAKDLKNVICFEGQLFFKWDVTRWTKVPQKCGQSPPKNDTSLRHVPPPASPRSSRPNLARISRDNLDFPPKEKKSKRNRWKIHHFIYPDTIVKLSSVRYRPRWPTSETSTSQTICRLIIDRRLMDVARHTPGSSGTC